MTGFQIATAVLNLVTSAEGVTNTSLDIDQISDELDTLRVRLIDEQDKISIFRRPYNGFTQTLKNLSVNKTDKKIFTVEIPRVVAKRDNTAAILYIGGKDEKSPYRVICGEGVQNALHDPFIGRLPIAHYNEGLITFYNCSPDKVRVIAVFEKPRALEELGEYDDELDNYPLPAGMIDVLIGKTAESYIRTMYRIPVQPNTQSDIPNAGPKPR